MSLNRVLAGVALLLGVGAAVAGSPFRADRMAFDVDAITGVIAAESDRLDPVELARWIRDRRPGLRLVDLRSRGAFDAYNIPTAERIPLDRLARTGFAPDETVVVYADGGARGAQAWVLLRAVGLESVFYVEDGLSGWLDRVINASLPGDASPEEREAFREIAEVSRYFGGTPRIGVRVPADTAAPPLIDRRVREARRRGCAL